MQDFWSNLRAEVEPLRPRGLTDALAYAYLAALLAWIGACYFVYW